ncbi:radical SAM protein [Candidatus Pelagibacter bacterium]|nr:radical SAM protein [Candidatus Pelagibacter bacterium]
MYGKDKNIIGIGCDFQSEKDENSDRKLAIENLSGGEKEKIKWMVENMSLNKAFIFKSQGKSEIEKAKILKDFQRKYIIYRENWHNQPKKAVKEKYYGKKLEEKNFNPLCFDIEVASVCDLACPFCYRQYVATPDKIMSKDLAFKLIDQASELNIPSMKFNWRGEPLLNPSLSSIINYAKKRGVLETIINSNATELDEKTSKKIIESGLDLLIYSFDGGNKETYEKMRPGRFKKNSFENIYKNILNFNKIRKDLKSPFPRTKIQMILTDETRKVKDEYFKLFKDIVDDVSVKQYTERGGDLTDLDKNFEPHLKKNKHDLIEKYGKDASLLKDSKNDIYISNGRLPCEQPFQRVLSTYDGKVGMCCYDWGATHTVGYLDSLGINNGQKEYKSVKQKADNKTKGFQMMNLKLPQKNKQPKKETQTLKEIWHGEHINEVREAQIKNKAENIPICKKCPFKETYKWEKI